MHARKMAARLQAATAGSTGASSRGGVGDAGSVSSGPRPILLQVESRAGHGAGKPLAKVVAQLVDEWSFVFSQLGLAYHGRP
jgi:prolyl oligopeptidase PreP (S9A serine peptidase family)